MCGIAGIVLPPGDGAPPDLHARLAAMIEAQRRRGPDDRGIEVLSSARAGLANCRLAVRDLSPAGHMPMGNSAGTVWITYNGELYNTAELRPELEAAGWVFRSGSDTEVILHGYERWGERVVERLRGIFAFGILDVRPDVPDKRLFLARDQLGIKPLYYAASAGGFAFASELKALLASGLVSREVSAAGLVGYLLLGSVPAPHTIVAAARLLDAGCTLSVPLAAPTSAPAPRRYWSLPTTIDETRAGDAVERVRDLLAEAVRSQLVSDVPLGAFLSGGLDSSAVVALMRRAGAGSIRTCSMVFEEDEYSEAPYARAMAEAAGTDHFERVVTAAEVEANLDEIFAAMDQPSIDGVNTYFVSQTARQAGLTVALSGLGGDELFGGYANTFTGVPQMMRALSLASFVPGGAGLAGAAIRALPRPHRFTRTLDALRQPPTLAGAYLTRRGLFAPSEVRALVPSEIWHEAARTFAATQYVAVRAGRRREEAATRDGVFAWTSRAELATYTQNQLLRDTDVMSMAHSLEVRVPLLDHRLVEAVLRLPRSAHRAGEGPKPLLSTALGADLPPLIRQRHGKQGFVFPFDRWLRGDLRGKVGGLIEGSASLPWLQRPAVTGVWRDFQAGRAHWSRAWALAVLQAGVGHG